MRKAIGSLHQLVEDQWTEHLDEVLKLKCAAREAARTIIFERSLPEETAAWIEESLDTRELHNYLKSLVCFEEHFSSW